MDYKDYYATLGLPADADEQAIKTAFRKLARVHHPDVAVEKQGATERFKEINEAYTVLSDPDKRRTYDVFRSRYERYQTSYREPRKETARPTSAGAAGAKAGAAAGATSGAMGGTPRDGSGGRPSQRRTSTRTVNEEDFERLFRGFVWAYTTTTARNSGRSGSSASSDFSDFFESLFGNLRNNAGSTPATDRETTEVRPGRDIEVPAHLTLEEAFHGTTRTLTYGDGRKVEVSIPAGVNTSSRLRVRGQGERIMGRPLGDLYMTIEVQPHSVFTRDGDDLRIRVSIPYELAMKSGEVQIPTMDRPVQLKIPAGAHTGQSLRLRGQGMPNVANSTLRGDLIASIEVQAPPRAAGAASSKQKAARAARPPKPNPSRPAAANANRARNASRVRQVIGLALTTLSLLVLTAQALMVPSNGWLWVAGLAAVLLAYGLAGRSLWAAGVGLLAAAGCVWLLTQANMMAVDALRQAWPLLPAALGVSLLSAAPATNERLR